MAKKTKTQKQKSLSQGLFFVDKKNVGFYQGLLLFTLAMAAGFIYSHTFHYPFQLDDLSSIVEDRSIRDLGNYLTPFGARDIGKLSFAINYYFGELNTWGYHFVNVVIHIATSSVLFLTVMMLFETPLLKRKEVDMTKKYLLAASCALIFLAHPLQTQAVTYMVQRFASLCTLFYGLSFLFYFKSRIENELSDGVFNKKSIIYLVLCFVSIMLAMKTKENAFTIPFLIAISEFVFFGFRKIEKRIFIYLAVLAITVPVIPATIIVSAGGGGGDIASVVSELSEATQETTVFTRGEYFATQMPVILHYLRLFVFPKGQNFDYEFATYGSLFQLVPLLGFIFHASVFLSSFYAVYRGWKKENFYLLLYGFGIIWFYMTISVESSIVPIRDVVFEHRMYLPLFGLIISMNSLLMWGLESKQVANYLKTFLIVISIWFIALSVTSYNRNYVWANQLSLWNDVVKKSPNKARPHNNLGAYYEISGQKLKAKEHYLRAIELKPDYAHAYNNLGAINAYFDEFVEAEKNYRKAIELSPKYGSAYYNLGTALLKQFKLKEAEESLITACGLKKYHHKCRYNLAITYERMGRMQEAKKWHMEALEINPRYNHALYRMAILYLNEGNREKAKEMFGRLIEVDPQNKDAVNAYNALQRGERISVEN